MGTLINVTAKGLASVSHAVGTSVQGLLLTVGTAMCNSAVLADVLGDMQVVQCRLSTSEAGLRYVNGLVASTGSAWAALSSATPPNTLPDASSLASASGHVTFLV